MQHQRIELSNMENLKGSEIQLYPVFKMSSLFTDTRPQTQQSNSCPGRHSASYPADVAVQQSRPLIRSTRTGGARFSFTRIHGIDNRIIGRRARLIEQWQMFDQVIIDRTIKQQRLRLQQCVREQEGHFEHHIQLNFTSFQVFHVGKFNFLELHFKRS